jgi:ATP-dependent Lon protease
LLTQKKSEEKHGYDWRDYLRGVLPVGGIKEKILAAKS